MPLIIFLKPFLYNVSFCFCSQDYHRNFLITSVGEVCHKQFFQKCSFQAFRFDWYMFNERRKKVYFSLFLSAEEGGSELSGHVR